jgi:hypothetical protein
MVLSCDMTRHCFNVFYDSRSLRGRNTRSEKVARRGQFSVLLRRIVVTTQRKRTEKWTAVALLQQGYFLPRRLLARILHVGFGFYGQYLSGTKYRVSPEGVSLMDEQSTLYGSGALLVSPAPLLLHP